MITTDERNLVRKRLLELAAADPVVTAAAITGSYVGGGGDEWSDIDLAFAIRGELAPALEHWTELLDRDFGALHHWDLPFASTVYRVFLLPEGLEVDIAFTPEADFGPRGPNWRTVFGETVQLPPGAPPDRDELIGRAWHHVLHARACIERRKPWQAEYLISAIRDQVLALACLRLGYTTMYAKGADRLPAELTAPLEATLVRSLDEAEMRRALAAAAGALVPELDQTDPVLAARLRPVLEEVASIVGRAQTDLPSSSLTMPRCTIRKLDRDDAQEWTLLRRQALETHPLAFGASIPDDPQLLVQFILPRLTSSEDSAVFGAFIDGSLIGIVGIGRNAGAKERHKAYIWGMYVSAPARRNGAGEMLLRAAIEQARAWAGVDQVHLAVSEVAEEAKRLYETNGFREWGREPRALCWEGRCVDENHMVLDLRKSRPTA